jgi:arginyl-tRNA synthetase
MSPSRMRRKRMIRQRITDAIADALTVLKGKGLIDPSVEAGIITEIPKEEEFGDYSSNIAFLLAPKLRKSPQEVARLVIGAMNAVELCDKVEPAGKGFINFFVRDDVWRKALKKVLAEGIDALLPDVGRGTRVLIEFVSANPTGPLHIGHGRGAAVGDVLARVLRKAGYEVVTEYYVNDAGRQIETLGESTYARWRQILGGDVSYEDRFYQGDYVTELAKEILAAKMTVPPEPKEAVRFMSQFSGEKIMNSIITDLAHFDVRFDSYFRESTLYSDGAVDQTLNEFREKGFAYEKDGAIWFTTSLLEGDEDRVLVKSDGEKTYFASDIAYHRNKFSRGFNLLIDIWGSDHHGYIPRMKAAVEALGRHKDSLKVLLIQFVTLLKEGKPVGMSTRSGQFTTLREVLNEVGTDAARFFFLMRKSDAHLEFDLDLAKKTSNENPVYYVQYAHARMASIFRNAVDEGINLKSLDEADLTLLTMKEEMSLIKKMLHFTDVIEGGARSLEPHRIAFYLLDLVGGFHSYYNKARVLGEDRRLSLARLALLKVLQTVIQSGLETLGVSAPERM